jgi:ADP-heptose:LPS heptosyltransferase
VTIYPNGSTALRGRYLVKNTVLNTMLRMRDAFWRWTVPPPDKKRGVSPRRILVGVGGHIGDAVIATSILPHIKERFPDAEIGIVCGPAGLAVFKGHPLVRHIHRRDHWFGSRGQSRWSLARWWKSRRVERDLAREVQSIGYDAALDLYPFFPNFAHLFWKSGIETRIGYTSGGGGPLLTHALDWEDSRLHAADQHLRLLRTWTSVPDGATWSYQLPPLSDEAAHTGRELLREHGLTVGRYLVFHPGTGNALKSWPEDHWAVLLDRTLKTGAGILQPESLKVVITGSGVAEERLSSRLAADRSSVVSLVDRTSWDVFRFIIAGAAAVIGTDSVAAHVAAANGIPCITIMAAMSDPEHWRPPGRRTFSLTEPVPCAPCFQSRGCATMLCVRGVSVERVELALRAATVGT